MTSVTLAGGVLTVLGTAGNDVIRFEARNNNADLRVRVNNPTRTVRLTAVTSIQVRALVGHDWADLEDDGPGRVTKPSAIDGGDDRLDGAAGPDRILGGNGNDRIDGEDGNDTIDGRAGNDVVEGDGGDNTLNGGDGNDVIDGGGGNDVIDGGAGADALDGDDGDDVLRGGAATTGWTATTGPTPGGRRRRRQRQEREQEPRPRRPRAGLSGGRQASQPPGSGDKLTRPGGPPPADTSSASPLRSPPEGHLCL